MCILSRLDNELFDMLAVELIICLLKTAKVKSWTNVKK